MCLRALGCIRSTYIYMYIYIYIYLCIRVGAFWVKPERGLLISSCRVCLVLNSFEWLLEIIFKIQIPKFVQ